jgi:sphingolipid 4-desaturase/C4-monooxygenase
VLEYPLAGSGRAVEGRAVSQTQMRSSRPDDFHRRRRAALLKKHPEVKRLFGRCPLVAVATVLLVTAQIALAASLKDASLPVILLAAVFAGAFIAHALNTIVHDASHNLVLRTTAGNKALAIFANLPGVAPSAIAFRHYHLLHHRFPGELPRDADLPAEWETRLVGASTIRKALWLAQLPFAYSVLHPLKVRDRLPVDGWLIANVAVAVAAAVGIGALMDGPSLVYLLCSIYLAVGPHPTGAHILQEHVVFAGRSYYTASYYGPINAVSLNVGYHVEHHDFPNVPGPRLPQLRKLAPEFYGARFAHRSRLATLWQFVFDRRVTLARPAGLAVG